MVVDVNHWHIWNILDNVSQVLPSNIDILHDNNSTNLTLFVDFTDFELHQTQVINVESIADDDTLQGDDFINDNEIQYDDTLEDDMEDEEDVEYKSDDETSESETESLYIDSDDSDE